MNQDVSKKPEGAVLHILKIAFTNYDYYYHYYYYHLWGVSICGVCLGVCMRTGVGGYGLRVTVRGQP